MMQCCRGDSVSIVRDPLCTLSTCLGCCLPLLFALTALVLKDIFSEPYNALLVRTSFGINSNFHHVHFYLSQYHSQSTLVCATCHHCGCLQRLVANMFAMRYTALSAVKMAEQWIFFFGTDTIICEFKIWPLDLHIAECKIQKCFQSMKSQRSLFLMLTGRSVWGTIRSAGLPHCRGAECMANAEAPKPGIAETDGHHTGATALRSFPLDRQLCPPLWFHIWFPSVLCPDAICLLWPIWPS